MIRARPHPTGLLVDGLWSVRDGPVNLYVLEAPEGLVCVDAGWRPGHVLDAFQVLGLSPTMVKGVLLTHRHWDHARGMRAFPKAQVLTASSLSPLSVAGLDVDVLPCPGHTADSAAFLVSGRHLFTGDTVWLCDGLARIGPWWPNRDTKLLQASLRQLASRPGAAWLHTAHSGSTAEVARAFAAWTGGRS